MEWIDAHGLNPRGVWSMDPPVRTMREGVCAFAARVSSFAETNPGAALIFTTACDQMRRAADAVAESDCRVFLFNLPSTWQTPAARRLYRAEIERLGRFMVRLGGHAPASEDLEAAMEDWEARRKRLREVLRNNSGREAAEVLMAFFDDGRLPENDIRPAKSGVPVAVVGGPLSRAHLDLFGAIEAVGGRVVLNATEPGERCVPPPRTLLCAGREPLGLLTDHYFDSIRDVFQRPNARLYTWIKEGLFERQARGILLWSHIGCDLWRAEASSLREAFGLPVLALDAHEACGVGQRDLTRIGAFVESLR